ncbi:hypothetical protein [Lentzea aerocolonigenes]|uniref:hypothetical protein n=1 Tax=Lentzea aerocolonigenes TaxID=68170 RepID=UPI0012DC8110|nr:hypothetical protein [Lentzea aerocolonigenes]
MALGASLSGVGEKLVDGIGRIFADKYRVQVESDRDALVSLNKDLGNFGGEYAFQKPIQDIGEPPAGLDSCDGRYKWAKAKGGIDVSATVGRVSIFAASGRNVQITGVQPVPQGQPGNPLAGSIAACPGRGGGPTMLRVNLDTKEAGFSDGLSEQIKSFTAIPVESGTTYTFDFVASTQKQYWRYKLRLTMIIDGNEETVDVDNGGKPFETTAPSNSRQYRWIEKDWKDVTPGQPDPSQLNIPVEQNPCVIVNTADVAKELGAPVQAAAPLGAEGPNAVGGTHLTYICNHNASNGLSVQVGHSVERSPQEGRQQFEYLKNFYLQGSPGETARQVVGIGDDAVYLEKARRLLVLRDSHILDLSVPPNQSTAPLDAPASLERLGQIGVSRLPKK